MEELQDAIEDAQYVNAISTQEDGPRPVLAWDKPSEEDLTEWMNEVTLKKDGVAEPFSLDWTLSSAIGLFLFSAYLKDECDDYVRINFVEEALRWCKAKGKKRVIQARKIISTYLNPLSIDEDKGILELPKKMEINEFDIDRPPPNLGITHEEFKLLFELNHDPSNSINYVGINGPILDDIFDCVEEVDSKSEALGLYVTENQNGNGTVIKKGKEAQSREDAAEAEVRTEEGKWQEQKQNERTIMILPERWPSTDPQFLPDDLFAKAGAVVIESLRREYWHGFLQSERYQKLLNFLWYQDRTVVPEDFFTIRPLGRGGFGLVTACKKGASGKLYAMKIMNKRRIKMKKAEQLAINEQKALAAVESPFVVNLKYSFHSKDDVFLILDLMTGGDLGFHLHQKGRFQKKECRYYAARIMLGLQAMHDKQYVYRDLKPENCLLDENGRVKITDLGLATKITPTLHGAAGTRGYWAPEMLRRDKKGKRMPYGHTVDWFSFGCCLAEFISGTNPFRSEAALNFGLNNGKESKEKAIDWATLQMDPVLDTTKFDHDSADLCRRLLDKNEQVRLGFHGCEEIMAHPWFDKVEWESIISDKKEPPFIPAKDVNAASQSEIGTFAEDKAYQETIVQEKDEDVYKDWDWTNPRAFAAEVVEFLVYERFAGEPLLPIQQGDGCCCTIV